MRRRAKGVANNIQPVANGPDFPEAPGLNPEIIGGMDIRLFTTFRSAGRMF